jgi:hypothetical protein
VGYIRDTEGVTRVYCGVIVKVQAWVIMVKSGEHIWGDEGVNVGYICGLCRVHVGCIWGTCGVHAGYMHYMQVR